MLYSKGTTTTTVSDKPVTAFTKGSTSWLVGSAKGTDDSSFVINNQQQVAYLREFRFASFTLARDVDMYTAYKVDLYQNATFAGAFYGDVDANGYSINIKNSTSTQIFASEFNSHALPITKD